MAAAAAAVATAPAVVTADVVLPPSSHPVQPLFLLSFQPLEISAAAASTIELSFFRPWRLSLQAVYMSPHRRSDKG